MLAPYYDVNNTSLSLYKNENYTMLIRNKLFFLIQIYSNILSFGYKRPLDGFYPSKIGVHIVNLRKYIAFQVTLSGLFWYVIPTSIANLWKIKMLCCKLVLYSQTITRTKQNKT